MKTIKARIRKGIRNLLLLVGLGLFVTIIAATIIIQTSGDPDFTYPIDNELIVNDVTQLNPIHVAQVIKPTSTQQIVSAIQSSKGPISIGGGRFSMGGQVAYEDSLHFDMRSFNRVVHFDKNAKLITVQPGITWRDVQEYIDPYDLSIRIMQTYANFTVGGSISVNVHGRYIGEGPIVKSIISLKVVLANGEEVFADREHNSDIFYGAIGGYGGLGVITEATLGLTENTKIERKTTLHDVKNYVNNFKKDVRNNPDVVFHNGDLYPPNYDEVLDISWYKTEKPLTITDRLRDWNKSYEWEVRGVEFVADSDMGKSVRKNVIDPLYYSKDKVVWRNWEASYDVKELEPQSRKEKTYVLREYFIPIRHFDDFVSQMKEVFNRNQANIINVSIRHAFAAPETPLSWAREEVFAFVVYYQQGTDAEAIKQVKKWSQEMIDAVISFEGAYYLPYQIFASPEQFYSAYPRAKEFFSLKQKYDPDNRFRNQLWKNYYQTEADLKQSKSSVKNYFRGEEQTVLTIPEWYLVFNPLEYSNYLEAGRNPSLFPFMQSIDEYWKQYDRVVEIAKMYHVDNSEYMTMLQVIGVSTTIEYMYKALYESTVGRVTRWSANNEDTQEDKIIAHAQRAYSDLIFDEAWYKFEFMSWVSTIWSEADFFAGNFIRKTERKLSFTLEYSIKALYAELIGFASQTAYEPEDGLIYLTVSMPINAHQALPSGVDVINTIGDKSIISVPRWGEFTKVLPKLSELGVQFHDISGNNKIAVSYLSKKTNALINAELLFQSQQISTPEITRTVILVKVTELNEVLAEIKQQQLHLEHIYDY